MSMLMYLVLAD